MNRIIKYTFIIIGLLVIGLTSCSKDFLETRPPTQVMEDFFTSEDNANLAVVACYDVMGWDGNHNTIPFFFGDIIGKDSHKGGDIGSDQDWMNTLIQFTYTPDNYMLNTAWTNYYVGVNRCNTTIDNIEKMSSEDISDEAKKQYVNEIRFVRAFFYFELVKTWGKVPLVKNVLSPSEYQQPLAEESEIWSFIEEDLIAAAAGLNDKSSTDIGRANKGAANAMLAKAYIYQQKWAEAKTVTSDIIESNEYHLLANFEDIFKSDNENNDEIIFAIQFEETGNGEFGDANEGSMFCIYQQTRKHPFAGIGGWGFNCPTQELVDQFEEGDTRLEATIIRDGETLWEGTSDEATFNIDYPTNIDKYSNQKYVVPLSLQPSDFSDSSKDWIEIRYADVLLWDAEANFHTGGDWESSLNSVRQRAGLGASPYNGIEAIYHERRVELAMEGHRFWDIVRQGRGAEVLGDAGFREGEHNHFPIPQNQLDLSELW